MSSPGGVEPFAANHAREPSDYVSWLQRRRSLHEVERELGESLGGCAHQLTIGSYVMLAQFRLAIAAPICDIRRTRTVVGH